MKLPRLKSTKIKIPVPLEHDIQAAFISWCRLAQNTMPLLALGFAVPNGGYKISLRMAAKLKAEGLKAGVPDFMLPVPCGGFSGLAIEFKRPGGKTSVHQDGYIDALTKVGWLVLVCDCNAAAAARTTSYLRLGFSGKLAPPAERSIGIGRETVKTVGITVDFIEKILLF
jgi:hypothetical protein